MRIDRQLSDRRNAIFTILTFRAPHSGVANVARRASALDRVVVNVAIHGSCARVVCTRVLATIINTGLVRGTIGVALAAKKHARDSRIASIAWRTLADSLVTDTVALGASAAGRERRRTRRNAIVLYTRVRSTALAVRSASGD